jgi:hypothetical protein
MTSAEFGTTTPVLHWATRTTSTVISDNQVESFVRLGGKFVVVAARMREPARIGPKTRALASRSAQQIAKRVHRPGRHGSLARSGLAGILKCLGEP